MVEEKKTTKTEEKKTEAVKTPTKEEKKTETVKKVDKKKTEAKPREIAVANGHSQRISAKYSFEICKMIKGKEIDTAIAELELVVKKKKAVPMHALEVAHKPGAMAGGKYPVKAAIVFIEILKNLKANANANMIERPVITIAMANKASRPFKRGGTKGKRTHLHFEAKDKTKLAKKNKKGAKK